MAEDMRGFLLITLILLFLYATMFLVFERPYLGLPDEEVLKETVILYNKIFTDLYSSDGQTARLDDFPASVLLKHELYRDLDFLRARGLLLVYDMASISFVRIKKSFPFGAEVDVFEEWNYIYQKNPSRELASSIEGFGQGFRYFLKKEKKGWIVTDIIPVDIKEPEKKDEVYF